MKAMVEYIFHRLLRIGFGEVDLNFIHVLDLLKKLRKCDFCKTNEIRS